MSNNKYFYDKYDNERAYVFGRLMTKSEHIFKYQKKLQKWKLRGDKEFNKVMTFTVSVPPYASRELNKLFQADDYNHHFQTYHQFYPRRSR